MNNKNRSSWSSYKAIKHTYKLYYDERPAAAARSRHTRSTRALTTLSKRDTWQLLFKMRYLWASSGVRTLRRHFIMVINSNTIYVCSLSYIFNEMMQSRSTVLVKCQYTGKSSSNLNAVTSVNSVNFDWSYRLKHFITIWNISKSHDIHF